MPSSSTDAIKLLLAGRTAFAVLDIHDVAIARALVMKPELMLFDEATSALDPELIGGILEEMKKLAESGMTMIVVTHEMGFAREVGDRLIFMDEGRVVEEGPAREVLSAPKNARTQGFLRAIL